MTIGDRISMLRKSRDLSQEELAERCGVSRQSVSKWEADQSLPEIEKITALSDIFGVTTDYLLKGIEPLGELPEKKKRPSKPYSVVGAALIILGVVIAFGIALMVWDEWAGLFSALFGFVFITVGITAFELGLVKLPKREQKREILKFLAANVWSVAFFAYTLIYNGIVAHAVLACPAPISGNILVCSYTETTVDRASGSLAVTMQNPESDIPPDPSGGVQYERIFHESYYSTLTKTEKNAAGAAFVMIYVLTCSAVTVACTYLTEREKKNLPPSEITE